MLQLICGARTPHIPIQISQAFLRAALMWLHSYNEKDPQKSQLQKNHG